MTVIAVVYTIIWILVCGGAGGLTDSLKLMDREHGWSYYGTPCRLEQLPRDAWTTMIKSGKELRVLTSNLPKDATIALLVPSLPLVPSSNTSENNTGSTWPQQLSDGWQAVFEPGERLDADLPLIIMAYNASPTGEPMWDSCREFTYQQVPTDKYDWFPLDEDHRWQIDASMSAKLGVGSVMVYWIFICFPIIPLCTIYMKTPNQIAWTVIATGWLLHLIERTIAPVATGDQHQIYFILGDFNPSLYFLAFFTFGLSIVLAWSTTIFLTVESLCVAKPMGERKYMTESGCFNEKYEFRIGYGMCPVKSRWIFVLVYAYGMTAVCFALSFIWLVSICNTLANATWFTVVPKWQQIILTVCFLLMLIATVIGPLLLGKMQDEVTESYKDQVALAKKRLAAK